jgi:hydrophobic/amphiphilic exporter-1 (mainly G- bacteria), HAE1 family
MLIGIVKKNAIMVVDFSLEHQRTTGDPAAEAAYQGSMIRFRPIMMTTAAAIMGTIPIAIGFGAGADSRRPLGLCVVGGLVFAQFVTLYLTPVFYTYMDTFLRWREKAHGRVREFSHPPETAHAPGIAPPSRVGPHSQPQHLTHD